MENRQSSELSWASAVLALVVLTLSMSASASLQNRSVESVRGLRSVAPLTEVVWTGDHERLKQLLAAGEDPSKEDDQGYTPWMWAILVRDQQALSLLLERLVTIPSQEGRILLTAVGHNDLTTTRELLKRGVPADVPASDGSGGTALLVAAASGYVDVMRTLLDAGANAKLQDKYGDTPLMATVRIGSADAIDLLLTRGADPNQADEAGRTALTWAARSRRDDVMRVLRASGAKGVDLVPAQVRLTSRAAAEKSLPLLQHSAATWVEKQGCFSCHHQPMALRVAAVVHETGFRLDEAMLRTQLERVRIPPAGIERRLQNLNSPQEMLRSALNNFASSSFGAVTTQSSLLDFGDKRDRSVEVAALGLARMQVRDGSWRYGQARVPIESTEFTTTAMAARALEAYGSPDDAVEMRERIGRARSWLVANTATTTDEKVYRLLGLHWTHVDRPAIDQQAEALKREQNRDGGWAQLRAMNSDAYATGLVLVALHQAGELPVTDAAYKRGVEYLLSTQEGDGSWLVTKRAVPSNDALIETGFPHGKFQIISYVGTSWATMALMYAASPSASR